MFQNMTVEYNKRKNRIFIQKVCNTIQDTTLTKIIEMMSNDHYFYV